MKLFVKFVAVLLVLATICSCVACSKTENAPTMSQSEGQQQSSQTSSEFDFLSEPLTSQAAQDHIRFSIEDNLQEMYPDYYVDYIDCIYISQEYIDEFFYNITSNVYFGYDYDEIVSYMDGEKWTFTVDETGETIVTTVADQSEVLANMVKKVAVGTGVIVVCAVLSPVAASVGAAPVACFFAGAAIGALKGAIVGAATSAIIGGTITGITTKSWEGALQGAAEAAADGFMWGAIGGAISGGLTSSFCFAEDTPVKTSNGYVPIGEIKEGDFVYSYDEYTDTYEYRPVSRVLVNTTTEFYNININGEIISTTATHPFYTTEGWVNAEDLRPGSKLLISTGFAEIDEIFVTEGEEVEVFNLTVVHNHTYTVGLQDIVVHNDCAKNARILRKNMLDAGDVKPNYNCDAHHIVPSGDGRYAKATMCKDILTKFGIDINSASNGVFLPSQPGIQTAATYHGALHTASYYDKVYAVLSQANSADEVVGALGYIKTALLNGTFMP